MKKFPGLFVFLFAVLCFSCSQQNDTDSEGRLPVEKLTSSTGSFDFSPMEHEDSSYVTEFKPAVYNYKDQPYTGEIVSYSNDKKIMMEGNLTNGVADGRWKFYYASGVVRIEGDYHNGMENGFWTSYYSKNKPKMVKYYNREGYMLMRKEYYDTGKIKNYQNVKCAEFGDRQRRIQFSYGGGIDYIDAERSLGEMDPKQLNDLLKKDGLMIK